MAKATNVTVTLQSGTDRTVFARWTWNKANTSHYEVQWNYSTGQGFGFSGSRSTTTSLYDIYNAPSNAKSVAFRVRPISKTYTKGKKKKKKTIAYFTSEWTSWVSYTFGTDTQPSTPSTPTIAADGFKITVSLSNYNDTSKANRIRFQIVANNNTVVADSKFSAPINAGFNYAQYVWNGSAGNTYTARCIALWYDGKKATKYSPSWSDYSSSISMIPATPTDIEKLTALSDTSVRVDWSAMTAAENYTVEYTDNAEYFDSSSQTHTVTVSQTVTHAEITGLESGKTWFFRVKASNSSGDSGWSKISSVILGEAPSAPTTWSGSSTVLIGEDVDLFWVHNSTDGSAETSATIEITINGDVTTHTITKTGDDPTSYYTLSTSSFTEGSTITWRVKTKGIIDTYSEWSTMRTVSVYAPPSLELDLTQDSASVDVVTAFPFTLAIDANPSSQNAISYIVTVQALESYETVDQTGQVETITEDQQIYSQYIVAESNHLDLVFSAGDISLENDISYKITCTVAMNTGLTATNEIEFNVSWSDEVFQPDAEIGLDEEQYTASITPYCEDDEGNLAQNVTLSVYRRQYDGSFVELANGMENNRAATVIDPHPALDFARYRIVAMSSETGSIVYYDPPGIPFEDTAIVIQWDEQRREYDTVMESEDEAADEAIPAYSGSTLVLPYNVDVTDTHSPDVVMAYYIGRKHPTSYYGTQLGTTSRWSTAIPAEDDETLFAIRQLAVYNGDVYVREPSGTGYWANIKVSYDIKHMELTIPVSFEVTRVDGGA